MIVHFSQQITISFPDIRTQQRSTSIKRSLEKADSETTLQAILRVLNEDERKVVETLASSQNGSILQRYSRENRLN